MRSVREVALRSACFPRLFIFLLAFCSIYFMLIVAIHLSSEFIRFEEISYCHQSLFWARSSQVNQCYLDEGCLEIACIALELPMSGKGFWSKPFIKDGSRNFLMWLTSSVAIPSQTVFNHRGFNGSNFMILQKQNGLYSGDRDWTGANQNQSPVPQQGTDFFNAFLQITPGPFHQQWREKMY